MIGLRQAAFAAAILLGLAGPTLAQVAPGSAQAVSQSGAWNFSLNGPVPTGTNVVGRFGIDQTTPGTTNAVTAIPSTAAVGVTPAFSVGTALVGKASAANLYGYSFTQGATAGFFAFLNATAAPAASATITPLECVPVPANGYVARRQDIPDRYTTGLVVVSTSSCTTYTAVTPVLISVIAQ